MQLDPVWEDTMLSSHFMLQVVLLASQTYSIPEGLDPQDVFRGSIFLYKLLLPSRKFLIDLFPHLPQSLCEGCCLLQDTKRAPAEATISEEAGVQSLFLLSSQCFLDSPVMLTSTPNFLLFQIMMVTLNFRQLVCLKTCYLSSSEIFPFLGCGVFFPSY